MLWTRAAPRVTHRADDHREVRPRATRRARVAAALLLSGALGAACTRTSPSSQATPAAGKPEAPCPWPVEVWAAPPPSAARSRVWSLIPPAHAMVLEGERPRAGARVAAHLIDDRFEPRGPALDQGVTDAQGRLCLRPATRPEGSDMVLLVAWLPEGGRLRLPMSQALDLKVSAQTEALTQVLAAQGPPASALPSPVLLNLRTLADTATGLLGQVKLSAGMSQDALIAQARRAIEQDARVQQTLARWRARAEVKP